jgi:L-threonylcarbamoyladenylate synthase
MAKTAKVLFLSGGNVEACASSVARCLREGGICIVPTDTIYGIVALDRLPQAVERIYGIKKRPKDKPFIRLVGRQEELREYTDQPMPPSLAAYWPGPLTIVFRGKGGGAAPKVALRLPDDPFLGALFAELGHSPVVAPSANISGEEDIFDCGVLVELFSSLVDLILCRQAWSGGRRSSTILDISTEPWTVLRQGALKLDPRALH